MLPPGSRRYSVMYCWTSRESLMSLVSSQQDFSRAPPNMVSSARHVSINVLRLAQDSVRSPSRVIGFTASLEAHLCLMTGAGLRPAPVTPDCLSQSVS